MITHGVDGYLIKVGDVEALAEYSLKTLQDLRLQEEFGKKAKQKVLKKYTPDKIVPRYENLYNEILKER